MSIDKRDLLQSFSPNYYDDDPIMTNIYGIQAKGLNGYEKEKEDVFRQFVPHTATWGLFFWEQELGIEVNLTDPYELRRARVLSKFYSNTVATRELMERIVNLFVPSKTAQVKPILNEYLLNVLLPLEEDLDYKNIRMTVLEAKPAHLKAFYTQKDFIALNTNINHMHNQRIKVKTLSNPWAFSGDVGVGVERILLNGKYKLNGNRLLNSFVKTEGPAYKSDTKLVMKVKHDFGIYEVSTSPLLDGTFRLNGEMNLEHDLQTVRLALIHKAPLRCKNREVINMAPQQVPSTLCAVQTMSGVVALNGAKKLNGIISLNQTLLQNSGLFRVKKKGVVVEEVAI